jgi:hypothetical protein
LALLGPVEKDIYFAGVAKIGPIARSFEDLEGNLFAFGSDF